MIDTNVLISAIYNPNSLPARTVQSVGNEHTLVLSEYILEECRTVFHRKFPHHLPAFEAMLVGFNLEIVPIADASDITLSDPKDQPILNSAVALLSTKNAPSRCGAFQLVVIVTLVDALHLSCLHALGADFGALDLAVDASGNLLHVWRKGTIGHPM